MTAALVAAGFTAAILRAIDEFALQAGSLHQGVALAGAAVALGALLGLWYPRRLIRRRLRGGGHPSANSGSPDVDAVFAALLSAVLILALALAIGLSLLAIGRAEGWRAVIVRDLVLPPACVFAVVVAPPFVSVVVVSGVSTMLVFGLLGWHRAVTWPAASVWPLWLAAIATAAATGAGLLAIGSLRLASLVALAAPLAAAFVAALQAPGPRAPAEPPRAPFTRRAVLTPMAAAAAAGAAGFASLLAATPALADGDPGAVLGALLGAALLAGAAAGRRALKARLAPPPEMAIVFAILAAASAGLAVGLARSDSPYAATGVAALTAFAGAAALVQGGRVVSDHVGPPHHGVVWVGGSAAAGCLTVALFAAALARPHPLPGLSPAPALRILASGLYHGLASPVGLDLRRASADVWSIDLAGPRFDVVQVFDFAPAGASTVPDRQRRRLMLRITRALLSGGRLIIDAPAPALASLAGRTLGQPVYHISMKDRRGDQYAVFAIGRDVPEWVALRCGGTDWTAVVEPVP